MRSSRFEQIVSGAKLVRLQKVGLLHLANFATARWCLLFLPTRYLNLSLLARQNPVIDNHAGGFATSMQKLESDCYCRAGTLYGT